MKKSIAGSLIVVAAAVVMTFGCSKAKQEETKAKAEAKVETKGEVLARVNNATITTEDFKKEQEKLPQYIQASLGTKEGKKQFLDNLVTRELILQKAEKSGMDKDADVVSKLGEIKKTLIIEALLKKEIEGKAAFTEKEAEAYYNSHKDEFKEGEKVKISHIMVKTEKEANDILAKLKKKENFAKLAKKYSVAPTAAKGGDSGYIERGMVIPEFEKAAFGLKKVGDISPVFAAASGFHIVKLLDRKDAEAQPFEKVKEKIIETQTKKKQKELFESFVNSLKKEAKLEVNDLLLKDDAKEGEKTEIEKGKGEAGKKAEPTAKEEKKK